MSTSNTVSTMPSTNPAPKYEMVEETRQVMGRTIHRIRALKTFETQLGTVKEGDLGGFIESVGNLSHEGSCWVFDNAAVLHGPTHVHEDCCVSGRAWVFGGSQCYGRAQIRDNAWVYRARVYGDARVENEAEVYRGEVSGHSVVSGSDCVTGN